MISPVEQPFSELEPFLDCFTCFPKQDTLIRAFTTNLSYSWYVM